MDKNTVIGFLLMLAVVIGFSMMTQPSEEELRKESQAAAQSEVTTADNDSLSTTTPIQQPEAIEVDSIAADSIRLAGIAHKFGPFMPHAEGTEEIIKLENEVLALEFTTHGGYLRKATLKQYKNSTGYGNSEYVTLFEENDNNYGFIFNTGTNIISTNHLYFTPTVTDNSVDMTLNLSNGAKWNIRYTLPENDYRLSMEITQSGMEDVIPSNRVDMSMFWSLNMPRQEHGKMFEERNSALYYKLAGDKVENLKESGSEKESVNTPVKWIGYKDQFFSTFFVANNNFTGADMTSKALEKDPQYLKHFYSNINFGYSADSEEVASFTLIMAPNDYKLFRSYDKGLSKDDQLDLDRVIPLGWPLFRWINTLIVINVFDFLGKYISNYGIIILLLTIFIKLILFPFTYKSYKSQAKMRVLQPQLQALNEKYPNPEDAMKKQNAMMELYNRAGVNPMGGCLPMLLQMPILVAMFAFFPSSIELRGESFLWAKDLSSYDAIVEWDTYIPIITPYFGNHISLFCLLMTITNILYTKVTMGQSGQTTMPGMKWMMYLMPVMFMFFFNNYAAGLSYYYLLSLLITIIQTWAFRKFVDEKKVLAQLEANAKKPRKKSSFMARLEEAQRQQEAALREQRKQQQKHNGKGRH